MFDIADGHHEIVRIDLGARIDEYYFPKNMKGVVLVNNSASSVIFNLAAYKPSTRGNTVVVQSLNIVVGNGNRFYLPLKLYSVNGPIGTAGTEVWELH